MSHAPLAGSTDSDHVTPSQAGPDQVASADSSEGPSGGDLMCGTLAAGARHTETRLVAPDAIPYRAGSWRYSGTTVRTNWYSDRLRELHVVA